MRWLIPFLIGCTAVPFDEVNELGLTQYIGQVRPEFSASDGQITTHFFDSADGPMCLRGDDFNTTTRRGSGDELIIFLQGGGACWSDLCQSFSTVRAGVPETGILNRNLAVNPVTDWNVGYVPYCDGSLFAGDVDIDDDGDGEIDRYHRGLVNLSASLDAIASEYPNPSRVLVVGSSAGAYGTILGAMLTRYVFPEAPLDVVADGGLGLGLPGQAWFIESMLDEWGISNLVPQSCVDCFADGHVTEMTSWALSQDPNLRVFAISSMQDFIIGQMFLELSGAEYESAVLSETAELVAEHPDQYHRFIFSGSKHTTVSIDSTIAFDNMEGLPFDFDPEMLKQLLGTLDGTAIEGVTVAEWLRRGLSDAPDFENHVDGQ